VKNGAKKRVKPRRARTRCDARKTTHRPRISSFGTARASTVDRSAQKWQERAGKALARVYPTSKNRRYCALGLLQMHSLGKRRPPRLYYRSVFSLIYNVLSTFNSTMAALHGSVLTSLRAEVYTAEVLRRQRFPMTRNMYENHVAAADCTMRRCPSAPQRRRGCATGSGSSQHGTFCY
jgi:hypothetical protein